MTAWTGYFLLLMLLTAAGIVLPVLLQRGRRGLDRAESALQIHRERLAQLARDRETGRIGPAEAEGAEAEIKRAMLAASRERRGERAGQESRTPWVLPGLSALSIGLGIAVYAGVGSFGQPDLPLAARATGAAQGAGGATASAPDASEMREVIARLRSRLEDDPEDVEGWGLLARGYAATGQMEKAVEAYRNLLEVAPDAVAMRGSLGETLVRRDGGAVGPEAAAAFERVLQASPGDPRARYFLALRDAQAGRSRAAAEGFAALLRDAPAGAPYAAGVRQVLEAIIADAGLDRASLDIPAPPAADAPAPGPSAAEVEAAQQMSPEERMAMIRSMVAQLEARLAEEPGDVEGWLRLARSKAVLGDRAAALAALEAGLAANPGAAALERALDDLGGG